MRKFLSVLLAVTMAVGMTLGVSAANTGPIKGIDEANYVANIGANVSAITLNDDSKVFSSLNGLADLDVSPGDVIKIPLTGDLFIDANKNPWGGKGTAVPVSTLRNADVAVRTSSTAGSDTAVITLEGSKTSSYIKIAFVKDPAAIGKKFAFSVYLSYKGTRKTETRISVKGRLEESVIEVDSDWDYVDISKGATIKAMTSVKNIDIYLGEYCTIRRNLVKGKTYTGSVTTDILSKDEALFTKYKDLDYIYRLQTVGLKVEGNIVHLDLDSVYYVYNTNGTYIGTTKNPLPYWTKYYLTSKKYDSLVV